MCSVLPSVCVSETRVKAPNNVRSKCQWNLALATRLDTTKQRSHTFAPFPAWAKRWLALISSRERTPPEPLCRRRVPQQPGDWFHPNTNPVAGVGAPAQPLCYFFSAREQVGSCTGAALGACSAARHGGHGQEEGFFFLHPRVREQRCILWGQGWSAALGGRGANTGNNAVCRHGA